MTTFVGAIQQFVANVGPWFLHNKHIGGFLEATALIYDESLQTLDLGLRSGQPLRCDEEVLPILGRDRSIPFFPGESVESKRRRLAAWKQLHRTRGTHVGEMRQSQPYFLPEAPLMRIVHQSGGASPIATWHTLAPDGSYSIHRATPSNWNWDGQTSKWSRFWVILYVPTSFASLIRYGDGHRYGDGSVYAGTASPVISQDLVNMILNWKSAHSALWGYCLATDPTSFDPTASIVVDPAGWSSLPNGNWGQPLTSAGVRTRLPSALWIYDRRNT